MNKGSMKKKSLNALPTTVTLEQRLWRIKWTLDHIKSNGLFDDMMNEVHVDEKQFRIKEVQQKVYILPHEKPPPNKCKSKRFITQVMFLTAVGRPRYDTSTEKYWDGKIRIFPFVEKVPAKRAS